MGCGSSCALIQTWKPFLAGVSRQRHKSAVRRPLSISLAAWKMQVSSLYQSVRPLTNLLTGILRTQGSLTLVIVAATGPLWQLTEIFQISQISGTDKRARDPPPSAGPLSGLHKCSAQESPEEVAVRQVSRETVPAIDNRSSKPGL